MLVIEIDRVSRYDEDAIIEMAKDCGLGSVVEWDGATLLVKTDSVVRAAWFAGALAIMEVSFDYRTDGY